MNNSTGIYHSLSLKFAEEAMIGPEADSELLLEFLAHCFTPDEAGIAALLPFYYQPWPIEKIIKISMAPADTVKTNLDSMVAKGLIRGRSGKYALLPILPGMFENVLMDNDETEWHREFARIASSLYETGYVRKYLEHPTHVVRSIPIGESIKSDSRAINPDDMEMMIRSNDMMVVLNNCQCRQAKYLLNEECSRGERSDGCIAFGDFARLYLERGVARQLDKNSMRSVVRDRSDKNLIFLAGNVSAGSANQICTCCDCCCHMLGQIIKVDPEYILTPPRYVAVVNEEKCNNCGRCISSCNIMAHNMSGKKHFYDPSRCIGCGLCPGVCPTAAIEIAENPKYRKPAKNFKWLIVRLAPSKMMAMAKSKFKVSQGSQVF